MITSNPIQYNNLLQKSQLVFNNYTLSNSSIIKKKFFYNPDNGFYYLDSEPYFKIFLPNNTVKFNMFIGDLDDENIIYIHLNILFNRYNLICYILYLLQQLPINNFGFLDITNNNYNIITGLTSSQIIIANYIQNFLIKYSLYSSNSQPLLSIELP